MRLNRSRVVQCVCSVESTVNRPQQFNAVLVCEEGSIKSVNDTAVGSKAAIVMVLGRFPLLCRPTLSPALQQHPPTHGACVHIRAKLSQPPLKLSSTPQHALLSHLLQQREPEGDTAPLTQFEGLISQPV